MNRDYKIQVIRSARKTMSLEIRSSSLVVVRAPRFLPDEAIARFVNEKESWINRHLEIIAQRESEAEAAPRISWEELQALGDRAVKELPERARFFAKQMGVTFRRVTIRNQRTRWGSCSSQGNLNFNVMLMLCPADVVDYVIVHELSHRKHMDHSPAFWAEVEKVLPGYKTPLAWLKKNGPVILARMPSGPDE